MPRLLELRGCAFSLLFLALTAVGAAFAQQPGAAALQQSEAISTEMDALSQQGDAAGARRKAAEAGELFAAAGEDWLAASYVVAAAEYDIGLGDAARIDAELGSRMAELLGVLDPVDPSRGDVLVAVLMDAKGMLGDHARQKELAELYESRVRKAAGEGSEADLAARLRVAYSMMQGGAFEDGFARLRETLIAAARTDHYSFTITSYTQAGDRLYRNGLNDEAAQIFADGEQTRAVRADVKENADFYLAYAQFRTEVPDSKQHFVPLYSSATALYAKYYGTESRELIHANDMLAVALEKIGQLGTAINIAQMNYDLATKALGPDDTITWRLANNLADVLRGLGAPSRALEYDKTVLANRTRHYGQNHLNTLVSANNTAQDYLDLGDYGEALRLFELCRDIASAMGDAGNLPIMESWIEYTQLLSGARALDDASIAKMDALITNADFPTILRVKAASLLANHFDAAGDAERNMAHLEQAYQIAGSEMTITHPLAFTGRIAIANAKAKHVLAAAAADFASLDSDLLGWVYLQVFYAGNRDLADATRALADDMLYDYARLAEQDASIVPAFADAARRWPSLETGVRDDLRKLAALIDPADTETTDILQESIRVSRISQEIFAAGSELEMGYALLDKGDELNARLQQRLNEKYEIGESIKEKPLPAAGELLAADQALVQYFITRKWRADRTGTDPFVDIRLYAIVSRKDASPRLYNLGDPRTIVSSEATVQIASLRSTRSAEARGAVPLTSLDDAFSGLYQRLIAPLEAELAKANTIFVVPDGQLFAVPFSLLEDADGRLLEDRFTVRLLTRPESLYGVTAEQNLPKGGRAVLVGGLDYSDGAAKGADPLPGTLQEVEQIAAVLRADDFSITMLTGADASEAALKKDAEAASIAHLATHGAYQSGKAAGASDVDTLWQSDVILSKSGDRRSMKRDAGDGRLYAFELMGWDLSKLDLLVLSACETGRGEETFVGGLRGLPTAINIAGAKRALLTLWPVADAGTANFMVRYYRHLTAGMTYAEALRQTRRDAIDGKIAEAGDPLVWAAFVMFEN